MNRLIIGAALTVVFGGGVAAQTARVDSETEVTVKDGKNVTVTGCVERSVNGSSSVLTSAEVKTSRRDTTCSSAKRTPRRASRTPRRIKQGGQRRGRWQGRGEDEDKSRARPRR